MPLEKKARVPVRRHMSLLLLRARIFDENFLFFFFFASSQNFDKEDKKTQELRGEGEKEDFCLTGEDDDDDD